jgi:hypothetical protein
MNLRNEISLRRNEFQVIEIRGRSNHILPMQSRRIDKSRMVNYVALAAVLFVLAGATPLESRAEQLTPVTAAAFARYIQSKETRGNKELADGKPFLWIDALPETTWAQAYADLKRGQIITRRSDECGDCTSVSGGLIHDWTGIVFIPGISLSQALTALQDYDRDAEYYQPEVVKSKLLKRSGDDFHIYLRLKQVHIVTVVLDTEYDIHYSLLDATHGASRSYSTRIAQVENAGESQERDLRAGDDHGFLWRLNTSWRFYQADGGVYLQCNAVSLTRDVPAGLGWLIRPFIENVPRESLNFTLEALRKALLGSFGRPSDSAR